MDPLKLTDLDKRLQQLALSNWHEFVQLVGEDAVMDAKVCLLRQDGKSYGEIAVRLDINRQTAVSKVNRSCKC